MVDRSEIFARCRIVVLAKKGAIEPDALRELVTEKHVVIDLVGDVSSTADLNCRVIGFAGRV